ncbi:MAG TPA: acetyl-CoA carboxylase biotin carboxyl carrier protein [Tepidisphaeraceae bacterium]|nr:acetyl-CoA carboxylase biotin carboxyl carrier protein [Tepidisphaeraceae bacterium]
MSKKNPGKKKPVKDSTQSAIKGSPMDVGMLEQIVRLMSANDLNTVEVRDGDKRVVLKRGAAAPQMTYSAPPMPVAAPSPAPASGAASSPAAPVDDTAGLTPIKSPMVGTFYVASSPDAKPFVLVGSTVDEETDVCIIEAMKVFNNIKAECRGTIAKILVTNGQTVEFGQALFLVKPA